MNHPLTRRHFLRGSAGIAVALPYLESLRSARAAFGGAPMRYLGFMHPQGTLVDEWAPAGVGNSFTLSNILSPLQSVRDHIVVLSNLFNGVGDEDAEVGWSGTNGHIRSGRTVFTCQGPGAGADAVGPFADGPSIDQLIAQRIDAPTPNPTLQLGVGGPDVGEYQALYAGPSDPVTLDYDPQQIFERLFSDLETPTPNPSEPSPVARLHMRRRSVLDAVGENFASLNRRVSAADRMRLEAHADKIRQLERSISVPGDPNPTATCSAPDLDIPGDYNPVSFNQTDVSSRLLIDLMVMALACDLTRVGTLQYTQYHEASFEWLGFDIPGDLSDYHAMIHALPGGNPEAMRAVFRWYMEEYAYLIEQLALVEDVDGSALIDNMVLVSISELGDASGAHSTRQIPIVVAGGARGQVMGGRHIDCEGHYTGELFLSLLRMFGQDDAAFGLPEFCPGPLSLS
ncbi:MAG: DUF1552 domain-containing protein [Myxococcota bacterium]